MSKRVVNSAEEMPYGDLYCSVEGGYLFWKTHKGKVMHIEADGDFWPLDPAANTMLFPGYRVFKQRRR